MNFHIRETDSHFFSNRGNPNRISIGNIQGSYRAKSRQFIAQTQNGEKLEKFKLHQKRGSCGVKNSYDSSNLFMPIPSKLVGPEISDDNTKNSGLLTRSSFNIQAKRKSTEILSVNTSKTNQRNKLVIQDLR